MTDEIHIELPKFLQDERLPWMSWINYKGVNCVADVDLEKSERAHRPIINIHYCMTKAHNGIIERTVNFKPELFKPVRWAKPYTPLTEQQKREVENLF
jgi:hypothetical protein